MKNDYKWRKFCVEGKVMLLCKKKEVGQMVYEIRVQERTEVLAMDTAATTLQTAVRDRASKEKLHFDAVFVQITLVKTVRLRKQPPTVAIGGFCVECVAIE